MAEAEKTPKEAPKADLKKYTVLKQFTGKELHRPGTSVKLDVNDENTKQLLTSKFIR